jgi:hypothetical protein
VQVPVEIVHTLSWQKFPEEFLGAFSLVTILPLDDHPLPSVHGYPSHRDAM